MLGTKEPKTRKGQASRGKILEAAAALFHRRGVHATSVDDILLESQMGKSQFYHYFDSKEHLVEAVVEMQIQRILGYLEPYSHSLETWQDLEKWCRAYLQLTETTGLLGCPIGIIAADQTPESEIVTRAVQAAFGHWVALLEGGLIRMKQRGVFPANFDTLRAAEFGGAAIQGGMMLTRAYQDSRFVELATSQFVAYLRGFETSPSDQASR